MFGYACTRFMRFDEKKTPILSSKLIEKKVWSVNRVLFIDKISWHLIAYPCNKSSVRFDDAALAADWCVPDGRQLPRQRQELLYLCCIAPAI